MNSSRWRLDGQTALVTGASRGIGLATVRELATLGADVVMVARDEDHLEAIRSELAEEFPDAVLRAFAADVGEHEQRLEVFDFIADLELELSLLVNNVGTNTRKDPRVRRKRSPDRKSTRLNSSHTATSRMPSSA